MEKNNNWIDYKVKIRDRLREFALDILSISEDIPKSTRSNVIIYQLMKSGTSACANYRAAIWARTKAEFFSKLSISIEEKQMNLKCGLNY